MKIKNFCSLQVLPSGKKIARVDVETGWWVFKKTKTEFVIKEQGSSFWCFVSDGTYTPGFEVECLEKAYHAQSEIKQNATN